MRGGTIRMNKAKGSQLESIYETPREFASGNKQTMLQQNANSVPIATESQEILLSKLIQKQQSITLKQLKEKKLEGEKQRKYLQSLIHKNRVQKTRAFTVREYEHLIKKNKDIQNKILMAKNGSLPPHSRQIIKNGSGSLSHISAESRKTSFS